MVLAWLSENILFQVNSGTKLLCSKSLICEVLTEVVFFMQFLRLLIKVCRKFSIELLKTADVIEKQKQN